MFQAASMSNTLRLADMPSSVTWARRHAVDVLRSWQVRSEEVVEATRLVVSELVTNAICHPETAAGQPLSRSGPEPAGTVELVLQGDASAIRVSVWDRDPTPPVLKEVGVEAIRGRGIFLVARMSARWGHYLCQPAQGKVVWAEVSLSSGELAEVLPSCTGLPEPSVPTATPVRSDTGSFAAMQRSRVLVGLKER